MKLREKLLDECELIRENCEYNAESHYGSAKKAERLKLFFEIIPAVIAAGTGALTGAGVLPPNFIWLTVFSSTITAVATILDPAKRYKEFGTAGHLYTALKHKARFLKEVLSLTLSDQELTKAVKELHEEYLSAIKVTPLTEEDMFEKARKKIKAGIHLPDFLNK